MSKPEPIRVGVEGIAPKPIELTPARPRIDWARLSGLPPWDEGRPILAAMSANVDLKELRRNAADRLPIFQSMRSSSVPIRRAI